MQLDCPHQASIEMAVQNVSSLGVKPLFYIYSSSDEKPFKGRKTKLLDRIAIMHCHECIYVPEAFENIKNCKWNQTLPIGRWTTANHFLCTPRLYLPVVRHVTLDQVASCESGHERELPSHDGGADDAGQLPSVLPGAVLTGSLHTQHLQTHTHTGTPSITVGKCAGRNALIDAHVPEGRLAGGAGWCLLPRCPAR